jgi:hypothetical protein
MVGNVRSRDGSRLHLLRGRPRSLFALALTVTLGLTWLGGATAGVTAAAAASAGTKTTANARANATGFGGHGGQGSGKAIGRSRVVRTAKPPVLTAAERALQLRTKARPVFGAAKSNGSNAKQGSAARPTSVATGGAKTTAGPAASPSASSDFDYFRSQSVSPGAGNSGVDEPSTANDGNVVLYTGNWYAAMSTDSGHSFTYVNPYTLGPTPSLPNGGFCCDQVAIHDVTYGVTAWGLLYCNVTDCTNGVGDNIIRLAVARNQADLASSTFDYYDFSAQTFGFPAGDWLDYPHFGANNGSLMLTMNVFNGGSFVTSIMVKFDTSAFTSGSWSAGWYYNNQDFTWTPTDNSTDTWSYWAATAYNNNGLIRVYNWPPNTDYTHVSWNDFSVNFNYEWKNGSCAAPDGNNWCAFDDSRVKTGGEVGTSTVYFMWDAKQGGGFAYPYVDYASFDVHTGPATSVSESQIWNSGYAWAFPGMGVDSRGHLGVSIAIGGGTWGYPGSQFLIDDDISGGWNAFGLDSGSHSNTRWGDYLTARAATTGTSIGDTWIAAGFTLHDDGSGHAVTAPSFYWVGRNRDDPFTPSWYYDYSNAYTEGASSNAYTGIFSGPSNCTCDYYAYNYWGDGGADSASLYNYTQGLFALYGPHTYAEEGNYTTTMYAYDLWGGAASGSGSAAVSDAPLNGTGASISAITGQSLTKVVANFTDADPAGAVSDYSATINWGDATSSAGTITSGFQVTGTHTYTHQGTYTISTTINDVGGASTTATGSATVVSKPVVKSVSPVAGPLGGGNTVTIGGSHFNGATSVKFGGTAATNLTVVSSTKITVKAPAHAAGQVDVRVTTPLGTSAISAADHYTYEAAPTITSVSPIAGPLGGGKTVTIIGTNFIGATAVSFGATAATNFTVVSATKITAKTPAETAGRVDVRVTTPSGTSAVVAADHYTYEAAPTITSVSPTSGTHLGGTTVTIIGTNFIGTSAVKFGSALATNVTVVSATKITATSPAHATGLVDVHLTTPSGTSAITTHDHYTYT